MAREAPASPTRLPGPLLGLRGPCRPVSVGARRRGQRPTCPLEPSRPQVVRRDGQILHSTSGCRRSCHGQSGDPTGRSCRAADAGYEGARKAAPSAPRNGAQVTPVEHPRAVRRFHQRVATALRTWIRKLPGREPRPRAPSRQDWIVLLAQLVAVVEVRREFVSLAERLDQSEGVQDAL